MPYLRMRRTTPDAVHDEVADQHDREDAVQDARRRAPPPSMRDQRRRPVLIGVEQRQAGERQAEEADDDEGVVDAIDAVEPLDRVRRSASCLRVRAVLDALDQRADEPEDASAARRTRTRRLIMMTK